MQGLGCCFEQFVSSQDWFFSQFFFGCLKWHFLPNLHKPRSLKIQTTMFSASELFSSLDFFVTSLTFFSWNYFFSSATFNLSSSARISSLRLAIILSFLLIYFSSSSLACKTAMLIIGFIIIGFIITGFIIIGFIIWKLSLLMSWEFIFWTNFLL